MGAEELLFLIKAKWKGWNNIKLNNMFKENLDSLIGKYII